MRKTLVGKFIAAPKRAGTPAATAKELLEEIAETGAFKMKLGSARAATETSTTAARGRRRLALGMIPIGAELIVLAALDRIAEDFIGFVEFLELFLGGGFILGDVGMIFARQFTECFLDFLVGRRARDAEDFVIIFEFNGHGWI